MSKLESMKEKAKEIGAKAKEKAKEVKQKVETGIENNAEIFVAVISIAGPALLAIAGSAASKKERDREHCLVEDDRTGEDLMVRHPLTNDEILELGNRMADGQSKGESLKDMGLLKKEKSRK